LQETVLATISGPVFCSHLSAKFTRAIQATSISSQLSPEVIVSRHMRVTVAALVFVSSAIHEQAPTLAALPFCDERIQQAYAILSHAIENNDLVNKFQ
jgi:purine nucleoside phosphorylase